MLNLSEKEDLVRLVEEVAMLIKRQLPIRFGIVPLPSDGDIDGESLARIFYHLVNAYGRAIAIKFAEDILQSYDPSTLSTKMKSLYNSIYNKSPLLPNGNKITYDDLLSTSAYRLTKARAWAQRLGVNPKDGAIFGNGQVFLKDDAWMNKLGSALNSDIEFFQRAVYTAELSDSDDILEFLFRRVPKRRNEYIFPVESEDMKFVNLPEALVSQGIVYLHGEKENAPGFENATVIWVVDDFNARNGLQLIKSATTFQAIHPHVTIGLVHNPGSTTGAPSLSSLLYFLDANGLLKYPSIISKLLEEVDFASDSHLDDAAKILNVKEQSWRSVDVEKARKYWESARTFIKAVGFNRGERGIIINGRVRLSVNLADKRLLDRFEKVMSLGRMTLKHCKLMNMWRELDLLSMPLWKWGYYPRPDRSYTIWIDLTTEAPPCLLHN